MARPENTYIQLFIFVQKKHSYVQTLLSCAAAFYLGTAAAYVGSAVAYQGKNKITRRMNKVHGN